MMVMMAWPYACDERPNLQVGRSVAQPNPAQLQPINFHFPLPINLLARLCQHDICNHVLIIGSARKASAGERNGFPQSNAALDGQRYVRENSCHSCLSSLCAA